MQFRSGDFTHAPKPSDVSMNATVNRADEEARNVLLYFLLSSLIVFLKMRRLKNNLSIICIF